MDALTIHLLGGFRVLIGNEPVPDRAWRLRKAQVLVQVLALAPRHALHREQIMDLLWPELAPDSAARNLHQVLHFARRALVGPTRSKRTSAARNQPLVVSRQVVRLQPSGSPWIDVAAFERAAIHARRVRTSLEYARALVLYEGDLLPESPYDDVFAEPRRRLQELLLALQLEKAALDEADGSWDQALGLYQQVLSHDATIERAMAGLLRACAALDARDQAVRYFQKYISQMRDELGLDPDPELLRLFEVVARRGETGASALTAVTRVNGAPPAAVEVKGRPRPRRPVAATALPLVGRDRELQAIAGALQDSPRGTIYVIAGEPGIGKSRLARQVCLQASAAGLPVSVGFGAGTGETPPFGPWRQVLHEYAARTGRSRLGLPEPLGDRPPARSTQDLALDVAEFLVSGPPALVLLEDLHWFDPASLEMLQQGLSRFSHGPVHFILTCRTRDIQQDRRLGHLSGMLLRAGAEWLELKRLDRTGIEALARAAGSPERAEAVYARSSGNPFFACHLLTADGMELPWTIRQVVDERLKTLRESSMEILRIAALLGPTFTEHALRTTSGRPRDQVDAALGDALAQAIIRPHGNEYAFDHDLLRQALIESLTQDERLVLHLRAAAAVDNPDAVAYHLGEAGDPTAVPRLLEAGCRAMQWGAVEQAHRHFERALQLAAEDDPLRSELLLLLTVRTDPQQVDGQEARLWLVISEAEKRGDTVVAGLARRLLAEILFMRNDERAMGLLDRSLNDLETVGDDPRLTSLEQLLDRRILLYPGLPTLMYALHRQSQGGDLVAAAAKAAARRTVRLRSNEDRWAQAFVHLIKGDVRGAIDQMIAAGERAMAVRSYVMATWCFAMATNIQLWQCGTDRARIEATVERMGEAAQRARERTGSDPFPGDHFLMPYWYWYGHWDRVRQVYDSFVASGGSMNDSIAVFTFAYGIEVKREQGDPHAALSFYAALLPSGGPGSGPGLIHYVPQMVYINLAIRTMIAAGELEMARAWLETIDAWHRGPRPNPINHSWALIEWAEWYRTRGNLEGMRRAASAALEMTREVPGTWVEFNALRLLGAADGPRAAHHLARAIDLAERCGFPFDIARARLERGRPDDLAAARRIFEGLNAQPYLRRIPDLTSGDRS